MALGERISTVITPATGTGGAGAYDLIDLKTVKDDLGIVDQNSDTALQRYITSASLVAQHYCNRVFQKETLLDEIWPKRDPWPAYVVGGARPLSLSRSPLISSPCLAGLAAPAAPTLSSIAAGALAAAFYYVRVTFVSAAGESALSPESPLAVTANHELQVASPVQDFANLATGWNVYIGTAPNKETKQNGATPLAIGASFTLTGALDTSTSPPDVVHVIENAIPLAEGLDFRVDYDNGELTRLHVITGYPKSWPAFPISVRYSAGYSSIPADLIDAALRMVKARWLSRLRDPALRAENIPGVREAQYWLGAGPDALNGDLMPDIVSILDRYRVPVVA